jgi:exodeoxyribonuclease-3
MKIATFNINGIKARSEALPRWLLAAQPDIVCLQEIKSVDENFPRADYEAMGYIVETHGQKGFNGVAILSKVPLSDVIRGLPGDPEDVQSRWIEAVTDTPRPVRICGLYLPNGNPAPGPKYDYKLAWMDRLHARVEQVLRSEEAAVFAGDYNVIPGPDDAKRPQAWVNDALFLPESRAALQRLRNLGLTDAIEVALPGKHRFTFWDYQAGAWDRNDGIRIDHLLLTPQAADRLTGAGIDRDVRAGDRASDHVPVWITLDV